MRRHAAALALSLVRGVGSATWHERVARFRSGMQSDDAIERALSGTVPPHEREPALASADAALRAARDFGARLVVHGEAGYPPELLDLPLAGQPPWLFVAGDAATLGRPVVAVVGTRRPTPYGERVARELASALARAGACVMSGLATGIDATAHRAALAAGPAAGATAAVLGTGIDMAYPVSHRALHRDIARRGLLVSELLPGDRATGGSFPRRNRLIAALARLTIVVEAPARSGALITAREATDLHRDVAAIPGPIDAPASEGTNLLLRDGAHVIASVADAVALAGLTPPVRHDPHGLGADERAVWDALAAGPLDLDTLTARSRLPARQCLAAVTALELAGYVECPLTGEVRRR
jgi:DNA processing protein